MAVNACGEIYEGNEILAGALAEDEKTIISSHDLMLKGFKRILGGNTSIGCVMTNAKLTKAECTAISGMAHDGFARAIRPVHTTMDGDTVFTMASGEMEAPVDTVGYLAEETIRLAILDAIKTAEPMGGRPGWKSFHP